VVGAISLARDVQDFWLPLNDVAIVSNGETKSPAALENLITDERMPLEWGGVHLRIDPAIDPTLLFKCVA
jgi:starch synthase (maltosyl-transferring)